MEPSGAGEKTKASGAEGAAELGAAGLEQVAVRGEQADGVLVEGDLAGLAGLGALLLEAGLRLGVAAVDGQQAAVEVDVAPAQGGDLASARAGEHGEPEKQAPFRVGPGGVEEPRGFVGAGRVGFGALRRGRDGHCGLIDAEVLPAHGAAEGATDDVMDLSRRAAAQWAARVAVAGAAGAHRAAAVQARVEALQELGVEPCGGERAEGRQDVEADQVVVALAGRVLQDHNIEPLLDGLPDRQVGLGLLVLVDLALKAGERLLGLVDGLDRLAGVAGPARKRVGAGEDDGAVGAAGQLLDVAATPALARGHGMDARSALSHDPSHAACLRAISRRGTAGQRVVPPAGFEPALPPPEGGALSPELRGPYPDEPSLRPARVPAGSGSTARRRRTPSRGRTR